MTAVREWIRDHDDRLSFVILYVGGAVALSVWLNLFWVTMLMLVHFGLEIVRGRLLDAKSAFLHALWEVKLDIAMVLFSLVVALYADHIFGLLGIGQAARAGQASRGLQLAARFAIVERALRVILLTMDDVARLVQAALKFRSRRREPAASPMTLTPEEAAITFERSDVLSLAFGAACLVLILLVPVMTGAPAANVGDQIAHEMSPYK